MKTFTRAPLIAVIAIASGLIVLLGYFLPSPLLQGLRLVFLGWGVTLLGFASLLGVTNLVLVHLRKMREPQSRNFYSFILVVAFAATLFFGLWYTPADARFQQVVASIQVPLETSLMAVLAISLAYASLRLLQRRKNILSIVFVFSALVFLIFGSGVLSYFKDVPLLADVLTIIEQLPMAGARGILLGVGLGSLATGLRILLGADRPYSG